MILVPLVQHVTFSVSSYEYATLFGLSECGLVLHSVLYSEAVDMYGLIVEFVTSALLDEKRRPRGSRLSNGGQERAKGPILGKRPYSGRQRQEQGTDRAGVQKRG